MASVYRVGTGISEVTDPAIGLTMQGFAYDEQKTWGVESALYSRAFIVEDQAAGRRVVIVVADIWTGTRVVKQEVMKRLRERPGFSQLYNDDNVMLCGTHTHSAPGGYAGYRLYDMTGGGFDKHTFECVVSGILESIIAAHGNLAPGKVYVNRGDLLDCGRNRSLDAYNNNPKAERDAAGTATDTGMLVLKFVRSNRGEQGPYREYPVGVLSWFAIHPTDLGQNNHRVSGDNKGYASALFEAFVNLVPTSPSPFVAAFANANAGDVSGNVEYGRIPDGVHDFEHVQKHGKQQFDKAKELFESATEELSGTIDYRHTHVDMSRVVMNPTERTWPAALGLSFAAGSREDGVPKPDVGVQEGVTTNSPNWGTLVSVAASGLAAIFDLVAGIPLVNSFPQEVQAGHLPKPILFAIGARPDLAPSILPLQLLRIGQLALTGVPAEFTAMAGRNLRNSVLGELKDAGVRHVQIAGYANDYSQYVTTVKEYEKQHYEGASTLFGPHTLAAYTHEFGKLARALKSGSPVGTGPPPPVGSLSPTARRWTFRNLSGNVVDLKFYKEDDWSKRIPLATARIGPWCEVAIPATRDAAKVVFDGAREAIINTDQLVTIIDEEGSKLIIEAYRPPAKTYLPRFIEITGHLQNIGDVQEANGHFLGTRGQGLRLEGFQISSSIPPMYLSLEYMAHVGGKDTPWTPAGQFVGTKGQAIAIEGFAIRLGGFQASNYDVDYFAHLAGTGDTPTKRNGEFCGTRGESRSVEGMRVTVRPKS